MACLGAPVLCLAMDRKFFGVDTLLQHTPVGTAAGLPWIAQLMLAMGIWIAWRPASALVGGVLAASALWAAVFGLSLLPMSLTALWFFGFGLFGLAPLIAAERCGEAAWRTCAAALKQDAAGHVARRFVLGLALGVALPLSGPGLRMLAERDVEQLLADPSAGVPLRLELLRPVLVVLLDDPADELAQRWWEADDERLVAALEAAYASLTGESVQSSPRVRQLGD